VGRDVAGGDRLGGEDAVLAEAGRTPARNHRVVGDPDVVLDNSVIVLDGGLVVDVVVVAVDVGVVGDGDAVADGEFPAVVEVDVVVDDDVVAHGDVVAVGEGDALEKRQFSPTSSKRCSAIIFRKRSANSTLSAIGVASNWRQSHWRCFDRVNRSSSFSA